NERKIVLLSRAEALRPAAAAAHAAAPVVAHVRRSAAVHIRAATLNTGRQDGRLVFRRDGTVYPDGCVYAADVGRNGLNRNRGPTGRRGAIGRLPVIDQAAGNQRRNQEKSP